MISDPTGTETRRGRLDRKCDIGLTRRILHLETRTEKERISGSFRTVSNFRFEVLYRTVSLLEVRPKGPYHTKHGQQGHMNDSLRGK